MFSQGLRTVLLLPALIRLILAQSNTSVSTTACNNSPLLCDRNYNNVTHLGAHDSPFVQDAANNFDQSGNQYYNSTAQLSAGVRLLTAQVQLTNSTSDAQLHLCHTSCDLYDAGKLSDWLGQVRAWIEGSPNEVVTVLLVNGADASASALAAEYQEAGITTSLAYTPASTVASEDWPTLQALIANGTRMLNFITDLSDNSEAPYLMNEFNYIFENSYENTSPSQFSCEANRPSTVANNTATALSNGMMPLMNHFLYENQAFGIQSPNTTYANVTNAPSGGAGNLGQSASECAEYYGRAPTYILVDFFNLGPAIATVDRLNGVTNAIGRSTTSTLAPSQTSAAGQQVPAPWAICLMFMTIMLALAI